MEGGGMEDFWIDLGVSAILRAIKNPGKKAAIRKAMAYSGDTEFEKLTS